MNMRKWLAGALCLCLLLGSVGAADVLLGHADELVTVIHLESELPTARNLLAGKSVVVGTKGSGDLADLTDGNITTINESDSGKKVSFVGQEGVATRPDDTPIAMTDGWTTFAFDMGGEATVEQFLVAGSGGDDKVYVDGGTYIGAGVNNRDVLYYELYVGDDLSTLFDAPVYVYDNSLDPQLAHLHTLVQTVTGQYIGFRMTAGAWQQTRLSELGIYGSLKMTAPTGATSLTVSNVDLLPAENLLVSAALKQGEMAWNDQPALLTDGLIATLNTDDVNNRCSFTTSAAEVTLPDGQPLVGYEGVADILYKLDENALVSQFLVAGSGGDDDAYQDGVDYVGAGIDNRHVLYFEIYAAQSDEELFHKDNLVWTQDNSTQKALTVLVTLPEAVKARFVGFRVTGGAYGRARLSELGVYGNVVTRPVLTATDVQDEAAWKSLVGAQSNLLKGEEIENNYIGYLQAQGSAEIRNQTMLTDGIVNWTAEGDGTQKASYGNVDGNKTLYYDLRGTADVRGIFLSNDGAEEQAYRLTSVAVYVGQDSGTLFADDNCVGTADLSTEAVAGYVDLSALSVQGRYVGFAIAGDAQYGLVRLAELGVYGTYVTATEPLPKNLIFGALPTEAFQLDARGLDNSTKVDENGNLGTGNTGEITNKRDILDIEPLSNLTDGDIDTRAAQQIDPAPDLDAGESRLSYQTPWLVYIYHLGGEAAIDRLELTSSNEPDYQVAGAQFYASYTYADLFKNESLLFTTEGERYESATDAATGETIYLPDATKDVGTDRSITYETNEAQAETIVRFVAVVITRPYALYSIYPSSGMRPGYNQVRASEFTVQGTLLNEEEAIASTYRTTCSLGDVTMTIKPFNFDDRAFFEQTVGGIRVTESKLPARIKKTVDNHLLSIDGDVVYRVQLVDKQGNVIPDVGESDLTALNGRDVEIHMPAEANSIQTLGVVEGDTVRRLVNAYCRAGTTYINAGAVEYPRYTDSKINNRDEATLQTADVSLVYLKMNTPDEVNALSGDLGNPSLYAFMDASVAGARQETDDGGGTLYYILGAVLAIIVGVLWRVCSKRGGDKV